MSLKTYKNKLIFLTVLAVLVVIIELISHYHEQIYASLNDLKLLPTAEHYTELYFSKPETLPNTIVAHRPLGFSFTIHNVEGKDQYYPYQVYFLTGLNQKIPIETNSSLIKDNEAKNFIIMATFAKTATGTMYVELTDLKQDIHFLVNNNQ